ncbi:MAG: zf-HC2 domain-containing protein [Fimbriimonadaceae bacterium]|nr:zf-HC2 domain-containing protein [Fimbriimonadaceae bacterium]
MNCRNCRASLSAYVDGELTGSEMIRVREHVGRCPVCRDELEGLRGLKRALGAMSVPVPPPSLGERILGSVREEARLREERSIRLRWRAVAGLAAGAAVLYAFAMVARPAPAATQFADRPTIDLRHDRAYAASGDPFVGAPMVLPVGR